MRDYLQMVTLLKFQLIYLNMLLFRYKYILLIYYTGTMCTCVSISLEECKNPLFPTVLLYITIKRQYGRYLSRTTIYFQRSALML